MMIDVNDTMELNLHGLPMKRDAHKFWRNLMVLIILWCAAGIATTVGVILLISYVTT